MNLVTPGQGARQPEQRTRQHEKRWQTRHRRWLRYRVWALRFWRRQRQSQPAPVSAWLNQEGNEAPAQTALSVPQTSEQSGCGTI